MFTKEFALQTLERAVKTFAQALVAFLIASEVANLAEVDFIEAAGAAGLATLLSVLTSIGSGIATPDSQPSLVKAPESEGLTGP